MATYNLSRILDVVALLIPNYTINIMKKFTITCLAFFAFVTISLGQLNFGVGSTYAADGGGFLGVQGKILYDLEDIVDQPMYAAGAFSYYFADGSNLWSIDLDAHYYLLTLGDSIELEGISGLSIARVSSFFVSDTDVGVNLGANFKIPVGDFYIYAQPKIAFGGIGGFVLSGGILF